MDIKYSAVLKNRHRPSAKWWGRIRQAGRERWVNLDTQDRAEAMKWVARQKNVLFQIQEYTDEGKPVPADLEARLLTVDSTPVAEKDSGKKFTEPGAILDKWEVAMRAAGMRDTTIGNYQRAFVVLLHGLAPDNLDVGTVRQIIESRGELKNSTKRFYCNALISLFKWMGRRDLVDALPKVKAEGSNPVYWSEQDMEEIILEIRSDTAERTFQYQQYYNMMRLIGSRQNETYLLEWRDIDRQTESVTFRSEITKSRKARRVPLPFSLLAELEDRRGNPDERVFNLVSTSQSRRYTVLKKALNRLGLQGSAHSFRRSRALILYRQKGADIKAIAELLGHSPEVSLQFYQQSRSLDDLRKLVDD